MAKFTREMLEVIIDTINATNCGVIINDRFHVLDYRATTNGAVFQAIDIEQYGCTFGLNIDDIPADRVEGLGYQFGTEIRSVMICIGNEGTEYEHI